jgi:hypothetical protein
VAIARAEKLPDEWLFLKNSLRKVQHVIVVETAFRPVQAFVSKQTF